MGEYFERNIAKFRYFVNFSSTFTIHFFPPNTRQDFGIFFRTVPSLSSSFSAARKTIGKQHENGIPSKKTVFQICCSDGFPSRFCIGAGRIRSENEPNEDNSAQSNCYYDVFPSHFRAFSEPKKSEN